MKMKNFIYTMAIGAICLSGLSSCGDDENAYQPGEDNPEGYVQVYFEQQTLTEKVTPNEALELPVTFSRVDATNEIQVPLTTTCEENSPFTLPESVTFPAGEKEVTVNIPFSGSGIGTYNCSIAVTDPLYNGQYTKLHNQINLSVIVSPITKINNMDDLVGTYTSNCSGSEYLTYVWNSFNFTGAVTITKVDNDTIELDGLYWLDSPIKGKVDFVKQTITFKDQPWGNNQFCALSFDSNNYFKAGDPVTATISPNGEITIDNWTAYHDWGSSGIYYYFYGTKTSITKNVDVVGTHKCICTGQEYDANYNWVPFSYEQTVTFEKGQEENTVYMNGLYYQGDYPLLGTIDREARTITFAEQAWGSYNFCKFHWDYDQNKFVTGDPVVATVKFNGEIEIVDFCPTYDYGEGYGVYYFLYETKAVMSKAE